MKSTRNSNDSQQFKWKKQMMENQLESFSLAVEKTPISFSPSVSPALKTRLIVVPPNIESLGWKYQLGVEGFNRQEYTRTALTLIDTSHRLNINLKFSKNFAMGTCGACELYNFTGWFDNNEVTKQNFVISILPLLDITYYGIASSVQMKGINNLLSILMDIGMKQVDERPNRLHGPNNLHLMVLDPGELNDEGIRKYCYKEPGSTIWLPLWLKDLSNEEKNKHFTEWKKANTKLAQQRSEETKQAILHARLTPIKVFASLFHYYVKYKKSPTQYSSLAPEVIQEIDDLMAKYNIKVPV